jgi:hypothetical protein
MKFLSNWKIDLTKVPAYPIFRKPFTENVDIHLAQLILDDDNVKLTENIKKEFKKLVDCVDKKANTLTYYLSPRYEIGRRYAEVPSEFYKNGEKNPHYNKIYGALISQPRIIKNTLFKYQNWIDLDQRKGHPTLIMNHAKHCKIELPAYEYYLTPGNFDYIVEEFIKFYSGDDENPLEKKHIKQLFNRTIYGGGFEGWVKEIVTGKPEKDNKNNIKMNENGEQLWNSLPMKMKNQDKQMDIYEQFYTDTQKVIELVYLNNQNIKLKTCKDIPEGDDNDWKRKGRVMSYWCGVLENELTFQAMQYLENNKLIKPRHLDWGLDGLTIAPFEGIDDMQTITDEMNNFVRNKTGFNDVTFDIKDFKDDEILHNAIEKRNEMVIEDPEQTEMIKPVAPEYNSFEKVCKKFEENHCKIINSSNFVKKSGCKNIIMNNTNIWTSYAHLTYETQSFNGENFVIKKRAFLKDWLNANDNIRVYDAIGIYPPGINCPEKHYNAWVPFAMEEIDTYDKKPDELKVFLNHIKILCGNEEPVYDYFIKWIGQMIKYPGIKTICPTLISKPGSGKGTLLNLLSKMLGKTKVYETSDPKLHVWGNFNSIMASCFLVNLNEISKKDMEDCEGKFKTLITDNDMTINGKNQNPFQIDSYHRFIATSNKDDPMKTSKDDRRNLIIRSSDEKKGDYDYFTILNEYLDDENIIKTCYEYFKNLDGLDKFHKLPIPETEYHADIKEANEHPVEKWIQDFIRINYFNDKRIFEMTGKDVLSLYSEWTSENNVKFEMNAIKISLKIKTLNLSGITKGRSTNKGNTNYYNIDELIKNFNIGKIEQDEEDN